MKQHASLCGPRRRRRGTAARHARRARSLARDRAARRDRRARRRAARARRRRALGARADARGCPRCGPAATRSCGRRARSRTGPGTRGSRSVLPLRAAQRARALLCPANLAPLARAQRRRRDPRRRAAAPPGLVLGRLRGLAAPPAAADRPPRPARDHRVGVLARRAGRAARRRGARSCRAASTPRFSPRRDRGRAASRPYVLCVASHTARKNLARARAGRARRWRARAWTLRRRRRPPAAVRRRGGPHGADAARPRARRRSCPGCTPAPRRSCCRRATRASACRCWRRWRAARRSSPPTRPRCRRPAAAPRGWSRRSRTRSASAHALLGDAAERARLRALASSEPRVQLGADRARGRRDRRGFVEA